jgi:long-chain fatty acid transport protein
MQQQFRKNLMVLAVASALSGASGVASAAAFALIEQGGSGMGNAYAGAAATAEDASTVFFNPAGMSRLEGMQFAAGGHAIGLSAEFSGTATRPAALGGGAATGSQGGDAGGMAIVPNAYFVLPIGDAVRFGIGIGVPFGLATEYEDNWVGRFQGIKSELTTININPSFSFKLSEAISLGIGLNHQVIDAELTNSVVLGAGETGRATLEADDSAFGWNAGALFQLTPSTRIGVSYRSTIEYELEGNVSVSSDSGSVAGVTAANLSTGPATAEVTMPDSFSLSFVQGFGDRIELLADATFTRWSEINRINIVNSNNGTLRDSLVLDFDDSWRYSIGVNYKLNEDWKLKGGIAFDETPVKSAASRTVRLPDNDRTWVAFGAQMRVKQNGRLDFGYSHLFVKDAEINHTRSQQAPGQTVPTAAPGTATTVTGTYEGSVDIFSVQYSHSF